jgi:hypothetical protein
VTAFKMAKGLGMSPHFLQFSQIYIFMPFSAGSFARK